MTKAQIKAKQRRRDERETIMKSGLYNDTRLDLVLRQILMRYEKKNGW